MAVALHLYSRPKIVPVCIKALMEKLEGRISQRELEERMKGLEDRQGRLFDTTSPNSPRPLFSKEHPSGYKGEP